MPMRAKLNVVHWGELYVPQIPLVKLKAPAWLYQKTGLLGGNEG